MAAISARPLWTVATWRKATAMGFTTKVKLKSAAIAAANLEPTSKAGVALVDAGLDHVAVGADVLRETAGWLALAACFEMASTSLVGLVFKSHFILLLTEVAKKFKIVTSAFMADLTLAFRCVV